MKVVVYLFGFMEMDWGALALGDVGLSLEIFTLPPPSPKIKSQVKITKGWPGRPKILRESVWISCGC
jgi:hypothetical protein